MRNFTFMLWILCTLFLLPSIEFASGYLQWCNLRYTHDDLRASAVIELLIVIYISFLLYESKDKK